MAWTFPYLRETEELTNAIRANTGGSFIQLSDGVCHYELGGPVNTSVIVLVHGFSVPYFIFDPTFDFLTKSGFRVLRYNYSGVDFQIDHAQPTMSICSYGNCATCWTC